MLECCEYAKMPSLNMKIKSHSNPTHILSTDQYVHGEMENIW